MFDRPHGPVKSRLGALHRLWAAETALPLPCIPAPHVQCRSYWTGLGSLALSPALRVALHA